MKNKAVSECGEKSEGNKDVSHSARDGAKPTGKEKAKALLKKAWDSFVNALFPLDVTCDCCGKELVADTRYRLCSDCVSKMPFVGERKCAVCGMPLTGEGDYCLRCQRDESLYRIHRAPLCYESLAKDMIHALKFGGKKYIATTLGAMMADTVIAEHMLCDVIVFVPMTDAETKKRGFNQAELLANEIGKRLNVTVIAAIAKVRETSAQKELSGAERSKNLAGAFVSGYKELNGLNVLLVDDVFTTGATANECAKALLKVRVKNVDVVTAAVTVRKNAEQSKNLDGKAVKEKYGK